MLYTYPPDDGWISQNPWDAGVLTEETEEEETNNFETDENSSK